MRVVVTGAAGGVGRTLIPLLCSRSDISHVIGIDRVPLAMSSPKLSFHVGDIRDAPFSHLLAGADVIVHLAFALTQGAMTVREMHDNNVIGSLNVFRAARSAKVPKIVNLSSVSVYGSGEELNEDSPLAPSPLFPYAQQKVEVETIANTEFNDVETVHLRSTFILGPNASRFLRRMFTARVCILPQQPYPRIQVIHENDVASAIVAALNPTVRAATFNLAARDIVTIPELVKNGRWLVLGIPIGLINRVFGKAPQNGHARPVDAALELFKATLTVSCRRAHTLLRWTPQHGAWEARASCDPGSHA